MSASNENDQKLSSLLSQLRSSKDTKALLVQLESDLQKHSASSELLVEIFKYLLEKLQQDTISSKTISACLALLAPKTPDSLDMLLKCFEADKFLTSGYVQEVRFNIYKALLLACQKEKVFDGKVLKHALDQSEGEKDPRNLALLFDLFSNSYPNLSMDEKTQLWETLAAYFPLTFRNGSSQLLIDGSQLSSSMLYILGAPEFVKEFSNLIFDKVRGDPKEKEATIEAAAEWLSYAKERPELLASLSINLAEIESKSRKLLPDTAPIYRACISLLLTQDQLFSAKNVFLQEVANSAMKSAAVELTSAPGSVISLTIAEEWHKIIVEEEVSSSMISSFLEILFNTIEERIISKPPTLTVLCENIFAMCLSLQHKPLFTDLSVKLNNSQKLVDALASLSSESNQVKCVALTIVRLCKETTLNDEQLKSFHRLDFIYRVSRDPSLVTESINLNQMEDLIGHGIKIDTIGPKIWLREFGKVESEDYLRLERVGLMMLKDSPKYSFSEQELELAKKKILELALGGSKEQKDLIKVALELLNSFDSKILQEFKDDVPPILQRLLLKTFGIEPKFKFDRSKLEDKYYCKLLTELAKKKLLKLNEEELIELSTFGLFKALALFFLSSRENIRKLSGLLDALLKLNKGEAIIDFVQKIVEVKGSFPPIQLQKCKEIISKFMTQLNPESHKDILIHIQLFLDPENAIDKISLHLASEKILKAMLVTLVKLSDEKLKVLPTSVFEKCIDSSNDVFSVAQLLHIIPRLGSMSPKLVKFAQSNLSHPKRLVRQLAGKALNTHACGAEDAC